VAGGLASHLGVDPVLVRLAFVALVFAGGAGVLLYLVAWLIVPLEEGPYRPEDAAAPAPGRVTPPPEAPARATGSDTARIVVGTALIGIGGLLLLDWVIPDLGKFFWPIALIALGAGLFALGTRR
jgi:phage shock protein C